MRVRSGLSKTLRTIFAATVLAMPLSAPDDALARKETSPRPPIPSIAVRSENNTSKNADARLDYMSRCFRPSTGQGRDRAPEIAGVLDAVDQNSKLGRAILERASDADIVFCVESPEKNANGAAAVFRPGLNIVGLDVNGLAEEKATLATHEAMHGVQRAGGLGMPSPGGNLENRVRDLLYEEAAAKTSEIIFAFEARRNGHLEYWEYFKGFVGGAQTLGDFQQAFDAKMKEPDASYDDGLKAGGAVTWQNVMKNDYFLDFYMTRAFINYSVALNRGDFDGKPILGPGDFPDRAVLSGKVNEDFNFTEDVIPPDSHALFARNRRMYFAFQRIEIDRTRRIHGSEDGRTRRQVAKARAEGNPYMNVNLNLAQRHFLANKSGLGLTDIMDKMADELRRNQPPRPDYPGLR